MVVITDGMMNEDEDRRREERGTSSRRCGAEGLVLKAMQSASCSNKNSWVACYNFAWRLTEPGETGASTCKSTWWAGDSR